MYVDAGGRTRRRRMPIVSSDQQQAGSFRSGSTNQRALADTFPRPPSYKWGSSVRRYAVGLQEEERFKSPPEEHFTCHLEGLRLSDWIIFCINPIMADSKVESSGELSAKVRTRRCFCPPAVQDPGCIRLVINLF